MTSKNPKQLELTTADNANEKFLGIYKIEDDKLTYLPRESGAGRTSQGV